jgi:hypothetical protein
MTKQDFLKRTKALLRGVVAQRRWLLANLKGHLDSQFAKNEIANIDNAVSKLSDAARAKAYLERKETALRYLIPTTNKKRHEELRKLIETQLN